MGFGSYDESEQEQPSEDGEVEGESVEKNDSEYQGDDGVADKSTSDMMRHL